MIRKRLFGVGPETRLCAGAYTQGVSRKVYKTLCLKAADTLAAGYSVIIDAVSLKPEERQSFAAVAHAAAIPFSGLGLAAPAGTMEKCLRARRHDVSDASPEVLAQQLRHDPGAMTGFVSMPEPGRMSAYPPRGALSRWSDHCPVGFRARQSDRRWPSAGLFCLNYPSSTRRFGLSSSSSTLLAFLGSVARKAIASSRSSSGAQLPHGPAPRFDCQIRSQRPVSSSRRSNSMPLKSKRETTPTTLPFSTIGKWR